MSRTSRCSLDGGLVSLEGYCPDGCQRGCHGLPARCLTAARVMSGIGCHRSAVRAEPFRLSPAFWLSFNHRQPEHRPYRPCSHAARIAGRWS
jgi:hypothetical protein